MSRYLNYVGATPAKSPAKKVAAKKTEAKKKVEPVEPPKE